MKKIIVPSALRGCSPRGETGPRGFHQRVPGNRNSPLLHEHPQQCDGTVAAAEQCFRLRIKAERTEDVRCCHLPIYRQFRNA